MQELPGFQNKNLLHAPTNSSRDPSEYVAFYLFNSLAARNNGSADDCSTHFSRGG